MAVKEVILILRWRQYVKIVIFKVWAGSRKFLGRRIKNVWVIERVITMRIRGFQQQVWQTLPVYDISEYPKDNVDNIWVWDSLCISLLILSEFKRIN